MVNYKPWSLEEFGVAYLAKAKGTDVGKASAGSDEVEHMFGVFLETFENTMVKAQKMAIDLPDTFGTTHETWLHTLQECLCGFGKGIGDLDEKQWAGWQQYYRANGYEMTPAQVVALTLTIEARISVALARFISFLQKLEE